MFSIFLFMLFSTLTLGNLIVNITSPNGDSLESIDLSIYQILELQMDLSSFILPFTFNDYYIDLLIDKTIINSFNDSIYFKLMSRSDKEQKIQFQLSNTLTEYLNNSNNDKLTQITLLIEKIKSITIIKSPSRSVFGTSKLYPIIISQQQLADFMLPYNMPLPNTYSIEYSNSTNSDFIQYGQEFWQEYTAIDITLVSIPWLPFFGNCENFGSYLYFYNLIENDQFCSLKSEADTVVVNVIPTKGISAVGDDCNIPLQCKFLENVTAEYDGKKWWQAESNNLFYISQKALDGQFIFSNDDDSKSNYFSNLISSQDDTIIPVSFQTQGVLLSSVPTQFTLEILYNQVSTTEKIIVTATVTAKNYVKTEDANNSYNLTIIYRPMDYLELINSFQFNILIYLFLYVIIGSLTILGIILLWILNKSLSTVQNPPKLRINQTFLIAFLPAITGCVRATIPIIIYILILDNAFGSPKDTNGLFSSVFYKYDNMEIAPDLQSSYNKGRIGLLLIISGIIIIKLASKLINPQPNEEELANIKSNYEKLNEEKNYDFSEQNDDENKDSTLKQDEIRENQNKIMQSDNQSHNAISRQGTIISRVPGSAPPVPNYNNNQPPKKSTFRKQSMFKALNSSLRDNQSQKDSPLQKRNSQILQEKQNSISVIKKEVTQEDVIESLKDCLIGKDYHYQLMCLCSGATILLLLGFSYQKLFYTNIYYFLIVLQFIDAFFYWLLTVYLVEELMLIEPLMACLEVTQFVMFMAAESFQEFVFSYLIRLSLIILFRTYLNPILKNVSLFAQKLIVLFGGWYRQLIYSEGKPIEVTQEIKDKNISFYLGQHTDSKFTEEQSVEYVIQMTLSFSSKVHATFLKPIMLVLIKIFEEESQIPNQYYIGFREFDYYIYFAFVVIFPQMIIDIYVLNSLELIYGYKLFDYFDYCKYRNDFRIQKLFEHSLSLDKSLAKQYRSTDNMKFTDQFYYNGSLIIYSIFMIILGVTIVIRNNYPFYEDPVIFVMIVFLWFFLALIKFGMVYIWEKFDFWKLKDKKQKLNLDSLEEFLNPTKENLEQIIEVDAIKKHFIKLNKEWLINNLNMFVDADMFANEDEFLIQSYQLLINEERKVQKELQRNEQLNKKQKEIELKSRKKPRRTTECSVSGLSRKDSEEFYNHQTTIVIKKSKIETLRKMLSIWYYQSKQTLFLKYLVSEMVSQHQSEHCKRCGLDIELRVVEIIPFEKMANKFKFRILGTPFNKLEWIRYYETHQKFVTLCIDCENAYKSKLLQRQHQSANDVMKMTQQNSLAKAIVYKWMYMARSNILHRD